MFGAKLNKMICKMQDKRWSVMVKDFVHHNCQLYFYNTPPFNPDIEQGQGPKVGTGK